MVAKRLLCILGIPLLLVATIAAQAPDIAALGPRLGEAVPAWNGVDQFGRQHTLQSLMERDGLMLVFFRSADW